MRLQREPPRLVPALQRTLPAAHHADILPIFFIQHLKTVAAVNKHDSVIIRNVSYILFVFHRFYLYVFKYALFCFIYFFFHLTCDPTLLNLFFRECLLTTLRLLAVAG